MQKKILFLFLLFLFSFFTFSQERALKIVVKTADGEIIKLYKDCCALVIGVSDYESGWSSLPNAAHDAAEIGDLLEDLGFSVKRVKNPVRDELIEKIEEIVYGPGQELDNCLVIFFAGHGYTEKMTYGPDVGYIVPKDAPSPRRDKSGFRKKAISMRQIDTYARAIQAKHALFLFDSCFSGAIFNLSRELPPEHISDKTAKPVRQFITSGSADETVPDKSIFKRQLIEALHGEADRNKDGYVTGTELGEFLHEKVLMYSKGHTPQFGKINDPDLDKGDFVFVLKEEKTGEEEVKLPPKPPEAALDLGSIKKTALERIKSQWKRWQEKMRSDFNSIEKIEKNSDYTPEEKRIAWQEFINTYKDKNPFRNEDENLRERANKRINYWENYKTSKIQSLQTPVAPLSSQKYELIITSNPKNARVFIDGKEVGETPLHRKVKIGRYNIKIEKEGYKPKKEEIEINSDSFKKYDLIEVIIKQKKPRRFSFLAYTGASVLWNPRLVCATGRIGFVYKIIKHKLSFVLSGGGGYLNVPYHKPFFMLNGVFNLHVGRAFIGIGSGLATPYYDWDDGVLPEVIANIGFDLFGKDKITGSILIEERFPLDSGETIYGGDILRNSKLMIGLRFLF
jgi:hypothetical protein